MNQVKKTDQVKKINYQKVLDETIQKLVKENKVPKLLLHSCCAPCSSYVIEYLSNYFEITVYYYNPNIDEQEEYIKRAKEQQRLTSQLPTKYPVQFVEGPYDVAAYTHKTKTLAEEKEGGARCFLCYGMRLNKTAEYAGAHGYDYFATTLTISPMKNATKLNEIGLKLAEQQGIMYLQSDFKKREGFKRSVELSETYDLYRQDYCGCSYSKKEMEQRMETTT